MKKIIRLTAALLIAALAPGGFIVFGLMLALVNAVSNRDKKDVEAECALDEKEAA